MTAAYLMTRGGPRLNRYDYQFIGPVPPARWWDAATPHIQTTQREIVVARHSGGVGVMASGVPSERRDEGGTPIRYTFVIDDLRPDPALLHRIVALAWSADGYERLGCELDKEFGAGRVDALIEGADPAGDVPQRTAAILHSALDEAFPGGPDRDGSWSGGVGNAEAREAFLTRVSRIAAGEADGWAFTSHALGTAKGAAEAAADLDAPVAILLLDPDGSSEIVELPSPGKGPALKQERHSRTPIVIGLAAATAAALLAILWWIVRSAG